MSRSAPQTSVTVSAEVAEALDAGRPVVALESTIIAHGLPRPRNLEVAAELEETLRAAGVVPATVGVLDGVLTVGLSAAGLERMAAGDGIAKAGVRVFATGGLGGVHRGAASSFDESADLHTLARTPITVVCAGVKSILDVAATLERLETLGVTVVGYGTDRFPGFYLSESGHTVDWQAADPETVAAMMAAADGLGLDSAIVVANPLPPSEQLDPDLHDRILAEALAAADREGLHGKPVTPFLLDYFQRASSGASLEANIRAVRSNVALAARIARAWSPGR